VVKARVRALYPDCWICGEGIDLALDAQRDPLASCVDEVIPRKHGGSATEWANLAHAHRICNGKRGVKRVTSELREACLREVASIKEARRGDFPQEARPVAV
jgi:5-methylcytosine-specific restriction endonuclease McrA